MRSLLWLVVLGACGAVKGTPPNDAPPGSPTLTVEVTGDGAVTSDPPGIECPGTCSAAFAAGTEVTLTPAATSPTVFTGWSAGCAPSRRPCTLTVDADLAVDAGFALQGSKRTLITAGAATGNATGQALAVAAGRLALVGRVSVPTDIGGLTATGGMYVTLIDPVTGQAAWIVNVANATGMEIGGDAEGNVIVAGHFDGMINLGNGNVASNANSTDWFVAKYAAADGAHVWSRVVGGSLFDFATALAVAPNGDVVVGGSYSRTVDFGDGVLRTSTTDAQNTNDTDDVYVARYAAANGAHIWSTVFGNANIEQVYGLTLDPSGSVGFAGTFTGNLSIGPAFLSSNTPGAPGATADAMFGRIDGASGNVLFAKDLGGASSDSGQRIFADPDGNLIVAGFYNDPADLGGGALPADGNSYVAKFTTAGAHVWSRGFNANLDRIAVDSFGDVVIAGGFVDPTLDLGGGISFTNAGRFDGCVAKLRSDTGAAVWGMRYGGVLTDVTNGLALDALDKIYTSGSFQGVVDFGDESPTSVGTSDVFVLGLEP